MRRKHVPYILLLEIVVGICISFLSLIIFLKLADNVLEKEVFNFDATIIHFVYVFRTQILSHIMLGISFFGNEIILVSSACLLLFLALRNHKKEMFLFLTLVGMGGVLNLLLKFFIHRPRPNLMPLVHETSYSFPSGHSMNSFIFYATLAYLFYHFTKKKRLSIVLAIFAAILILLIGLSRIYLGAHYPSDVLAGYVAGAFWFATIILLERTIEFFHVFKKVKK
jgi:undecaprenyl-diphosphatase